MWGGFMGVASPQRLIVAPVAGRVRGLTILANDTARPGLGIGRLIGAGPVVRGAGSKTFRPRPRPPCSPTRSETWLPGTGAPSLSVSVPPDRPIDVGIQRRIPHLRPRGAGGVERCVLMILPR